MGKKKDLNKRFGKQFGMIAAGLAIALVVVLLILTIREGREIMNRDEPQTTEPVP